MVQRQHAMGVGVIRRVDVGPFSIRWDADRAAEAYAGGWWAPTTLTDALRAAATASPERVVIIDGDVSITCRDLLHLSERLAGALTARMAVGSVVSVMLPNWYEAAVVYLGATLAGMVVNPILPSLPEHELRYVLDDVDSRMIFSPAHFRGSAHAAMVTRVCSALESPPEVILVRGDVGTQTTLTGLLGEDAPRGALPEVHPDSVRMVLFTSGTTGRPKGVLHTQNSLHALTRQIGEHWRIEPGDTFLVPTPIAHISGSIYAFEIPLLLGTTAVLIDTWNPDDAVELMRAHRCTHVSGATRFLAGLLAAAERAHSRLPDLKVFICGDASVAPSLIRRATAYFERAVVTRVYGSTEVPVTTIGALDDSDVAADTDGRPGIADVWLVTRDPGGMGGQTGEIHAHGPQMLVGYLHPEDELDSFDVDGYFLTGDIGRWEGDAVVVLDRTKDVIVRGGQRVSPKEIEDILVEHPDIAEVAVVGVSDGRAEERAYAVIVPRAAARPDVPTLIEFLLDRGVAQSKMPDRVVLRDELPRNDAGKVLKRALREQLAGQD